jgi:hypothetical protein
VTKRVCCLRRTAVVGRIFQRQRKISLGINRRRGWLRLECGGVLCRQHVRRRAPATLVMSEHWHQGPKGFGRSLRRGPGRALHGQHNTGGHSERARRSPRHPRDHAHAKWQPWVAPDCRRQPHHIGYCNYDGGTGGASGRKSYPLSLPECGIFDRRKRIAPIISERLALLFDPRSLRVGTISFQTSGIEVDVAGPHPILAPILRGLAGRAPYSQRLGGNASRRGELLQSAFWATCSR